MLALMSPSNISKEKVMHAVNYVIGATIVALVYFLLAGIGRIFQHALQTLF